MEGGEGSGAVPMTGSCSFQFPAPLLTQSACHSQAQGKNLHKEQTHQLGRRLRVQVRRKGVAGTVLPEGKDVEGAACHPGTAQTLAYMLAQDPTLISASQTWHWHTTHMMTLKSPWASGTA